MKKIKLKSGASVDVQDVSPAYDTLYIKLIGQTFDALTSIFEDVDSLEKIALEEDFNEYKTFYGYTELYSITRFEGGIWEIILKKPDSTEESAIDTLKVDVNERATRDELQEAIAELTTAITMMLGGV